MTALPTIRDLLDALADDAEAHPHTHRLTDDLLVFAEQQRGPRWEALVRTLRARVGEMDDGA